MIVVGNEMAATAYTIVFLGNETLEIVARL